MTPPYDNSYCKGEALANVLTHGLGAVLSLAGLVLLVVYASLHGSAWHVTACSIFGASMVLLYTFSTLYHSPFAEPTKSVLRKIDHAAIFILIAGSYTPFVLLPLRGPWGWTLFGIIWGLAIPGVILKFWFTGRFKKTSTALFLGMGWLIVIAARPMIREVPNGALMLLAAGGLSYSVGAIFYMWRKLPYNHALWHLFVLGGTSCHFFAVFKYLIPRA